MDLVKFAEQLKELYKEICEITELLEKRANKGLDGMPELLRKLEEILPDWFYFMEQTGIGTKERILQALSDMEEAMRTDDSILLGDVLLNGLGLMAKDYLEVIEEGVA